MKYPELMGLTGNGIRKACLSRRTATEAWVEVWLGNVSDTYYNNIHGTSISGGASLLQNKTSCSIRVQCSNAPVAGERDRTISGINITNDPLVQTDSSGNFLTDPIEWYGLAIRKFKFTQLEDKWYTAHISTDLVNVHGDGACKYVKIRFRPKRQNSVRMINIGCMDDNMFGLTDAFDENGLTLTPRQAVLKILREGVDYVISPDDFPYCLCNVRDHWWRLPPDSSTDEYASTDYQDASGNTASMPAGVMANNINVLDALSDIDQKIVIFENLSGLMNPYIVHLGYHAVVMTTDTGDRGIRRVNGGVYGIFAPASVAAEFTVDLGLDNDNTDSRPADSATSLWIHDGSDGTAADPYDQSGNAVQANLLADMASAEQYRECVLNLMDLLHYSKWEHNIASASPTTPQYQAYHTNMPSLAAADDLTLAVGSGGLALTHDYYYYPRNKYMDFGNYCRIYALDTSAFAFTTHQIDNVFEQDNVPASVLGTRQCCGTTSLNEIIADMQANDENFECFAILVGDVTNPVDASGNDFGQGDSWGTKVPAERSQFVTALEGLSCPVFLLTSDHHVNAITQWHPNYCEVHASMAPSGGMRGVTIPASHIYDPGGNTQVPGYNRFQAEKGRAHALAIAGIASGYYRNPSTGEIIDNADLSDRFVAEGGTLDYEESTDNPVIEAGGVRIDTKSFSTIRVR